VWGAGDCVTMRDHPILPKAGVYAVRQAPILERSLRAALGKGRPKRYTPQRSYLALINTGDDRAIFRWRTITLHSRWAWRLKDRIDRRFVERYRRCDERSGSAS
jgi:NADH dehydrogenase FAD-containing subunit